MSLGKIKQEFLEQLQSANSSQEIEGLRVQFLGKSGLVTNAMKEIANVPAEQKKAYGAEVNSVKNEIELALHNKKSAIASAELEARLMGERIDVSLSPRGNPVGKIHPLSQAAMELRNILLQMGFEEAQGPEIEDDWHNFTALNIPQSHPARQMHDTFYLGGQKKLLRTHTSNVQIRHMQGKTPPFKVFSIGTVYRSDSDATHTPMFHQVEGLCIDEKTNLTNLKGDLERLLGEFFDVANLPIRMRPSYFPFTEPSIEVDVACDRSSKDEIVFGKGADWLEVLGAGMVHPEVLKAVGIDPERYQGYAFGTGLERLAMLKYNIPDLRDMFEGDKRWLDHFGF